MNRSLIRAATYVQLCLMALLATGCTPTQPFFANESPDLHHYLDTATRIEYPDVRCSDLEPSPEALPPLTLDNHEYEYWDLTLEECVAIALHNSKYLFTVNGTAEDRQSVIAQIAGGRAAQFTSVYDTALQQTTTQSIPLTVDGNGNRVVGRGVQRANQVGGVEDALAEFDAQYSAVLSYGNTDRPRNVDQQNAFNAPLFQARDGLQQMAISKRMATGGVVSFRQQTQYSANNLPIGQGVGRDVTSDWTAVLEAQVIHPLMRGRGTLINRVPVVLARLNEDSSIADFEAGVRNLVYDVERRYWDLYAAYRSVEALIVARDAAQATAFTSKALLDTGTYTEQDFRRAATRYFEQTNLVQAALSGSNVLGTDPSGVYGAERELRALMGIEATDGRLIRPIEEPTLAPVEFDWFVSLEEISLNSPELRRSRIEMKQSELELMVAKNQLLPQLDLSLTGRVVGVGDELGIGSRNGLNFPDPNAGVGAVGSQAWAGLTEGRFAEFAVRLEFTPSAIGQRRELARINNVKWTLARQKAFLEMQERALQFQLSKAISNLATHYRQIHTHAQMLNQSELEYEKRLAAYEARQGGDIDLLLDTQSSRARAQVGFYRSLVEYNKSMAFVHYIKGTLLANNNIELSEGPWNKKAYWDALERARERSAGYYYKYGVQRPNAISTGTDQLLFDEEFVLPEPGTVVPHGIADEVILGTEPVDGKMFMEGAVGSGISEELMVPDDVYEMPELEMPSGPEFESVPAPEPVLDAGQAELVPSKRKVVLTPPVQPVSYEEVQNIAPSVQRKPLPTPMAVD